MKSASTVRVFALGLAATTVLGACTANTRSAANTPSPEKREIKISISPTADAAAVEVALQKGYFEAEGLNVKREISQSGALALPKLENGGLDVVYCNYLTVYEKQASGAMKLRIINEGHLGGKGFVVILVNPKSKITKISQLRGKRIAVNVRKNIAELLAAITLRINGVNPKNVKFVEVPFPDVAAALKARRVDAALTAEPFITQAETTVGATQLADTMTGPLSSFPINGYIVTDEFVKQYPRTAAAVQRALGKAQRDLANDEQLVREVLPKFTKIDKNTAEVIRIGEFPTSVNPVRLQRVADFMKQFGLLEERLDVRQLLWSPAPRQAE